MTPFETPLHQFDEAPPLEDFPFDDPVKEEQFQQAWHVLRNTEDPRAKPSWWLFGIIVAILAYLMFRGGQFDFELIGLLAGVVLLHELGHFVPMKLFGYTDNKLFLIPFFALGVRTNRHAAPAWQQAMTILLGPLPGLLLAVMLYATLRDDSPPWVLKLTVLLTLVNGINLLPLGFTDAGRLLNLILYSRNAWVETLMQLVAAGLFAGLALWQRNFFLGALAFAMLASAPMVFRIGRMTTRLRLEGLQMPDTVAELQPLHGRMLFAATYDVLGRTTPGSIAGVMRQLHDRVLVPAPGFLATIGFVGLYLAGWGMVVGTVGLIVHDYTELRDRIIFPEQQPEFQWKKEADRHRRRARDLKGPDQAQARQAALDQAAVLQQRYDAWRQGLVHKVFTYHDAIFVGLGARRPPANVDPGDKDE